MARIDVEKCRELLKYGQYPISRSSHSAVGWVAVYQIGNDYVWLPVSRFIDYEYLCSSGYVHTWRIPHVPTVENGGEEGDGSFPDRPADDYRFTRKDDTYLGVRYVGEARYVEAYDYLANILELVNAIPDYDCMQEVA